MSQAPMYKFNYHPTRRILEITGSEGSLFIEQHRYVDHNPDENGPDPLSVWINELQENLKNGKLNLKLVGYNLIAFSDENYPELLDGVHLDSCRLTNPRISNAKLVNIVAEHSESTVFEYMSASDVTLTGSTGYHNLHPVTKAAASPAKPIISVSMNGSRSLKIVDERGGELYIHHAVDESWVSDESNDTNPLIDLINDLNENIHDGTVIFELRGKSHLSFKGYHTPSLSGSIKLNNVEITNCTDLRNVDLTNVTLLNLKSASISFSTISDWNYPMSGLLVISHCFINEKYNDVILQAGPDKYEWVLNQNVTNTMW